MAELAKPRNARLFTQLDELTAYDLVQCGGLTDWNKPRGPLTPIRQQSMTKIGAEDIVGIQRGSADFPTFTIQSRLRDIANFMIELNCESNWQCLFKDCGDPGDYYNFTYGLAWQRCPPGDLTGEPLAVIEGDNVPIHYTQPFSAVYGPYLVDFKVLFTSRRTIGETGIIRDIVMFEEECLEDCQFAARAGEYGYLVADSQEGSPADTAHVWFSEDDGDNWAVTSEGPFAGGEDVSSIVKLGTVLSHRVVVARGSTDAGDYAEVAYADVTVIGQTEWVSVDVGSTAGEYINMLEWALFNRLYAVTNLGNIFVSQDGGGSWENIYDHTTAVSLNDISATKDGVIWVAGDGDLLKYTTDFGATWSTVTGPNDGAHNLTTCDVDLEKKIIVGDSAGNIYGSINNGYSWVSTPPQGFTPTSVVRIRGYHSHWKWAVLHMAATAPAEGNSRVVRSTDGGATWRLWSLTTNIVPNNGLYSLYVVDQNRCLVGGAPYPVGGTAFLCRTETNLDRIPQL